VLVPVLGAGGNDSARLSAAVVTSLRSSIEKNVRTQIIISGESENARLGGSQGFNRWRDGMTFHPEIFQ
jgi:hypothetical protein